MKKVNNKVQVAVPVENDEKELEQNNSSIKKDMSKPLVEKRKLNTGLKILIILAVMISSFYFLFLGLGKALGVPNFWSTAKDFVEAPLEKIDSTSGRTNLLILGKSGEGYSAPDLTDTIIFTSVDLNSPRVKMISIPRDIWVPAIRAKINSAYYWGKQKGEGFSLIKTSVEEVVGQPIHYVVVVDFGAFTKAINIVGGIQVNITNSFKDEKYPLPGKENDLCDGDKTYKCRYETVTFEKGSQVMDGETALKFVRSRNAQGDEGTDLAREQRQQLVILALKNKMLSPGVILSPPKISNLWNLAKDSVETNLDLGAFAVLGRKLLEASNSVSAEVIPEDLLVHPPISAKYDLQYVFVSKSGNWLKLQDWVKETIAQ
jgi:LCP family protein required for cell wall assembly